MHPILFQIGNFSLYTYGLFVALGFASALWFTQQNAKPHAINPQVISDIFFVGLISAILGARLLYVVIDFKAYQDDFLGIFKIWEGGLVFFGGFIMAVIVTFIHLRLRDLNVWKTADIITPGIVLGHAVGRIGCFFAGCCYGKACNLPIAITFKHPESLAPLNIALHPTQIYSVLSNLILFFFIFWLQKHKRFNGMIFWTYIILYSIFRSAIEFFRGDFRGDFFVEFLSVSQGIGMVFFFIALIMLFILSKKAHDTD
ncbi:MAG: prolipoprotein diacylglyceryl transferase [Desulfobacteraceae bacterium]|nr:prolipoprotein diacylglyceryl transferase [Desulfobacteraceae bacterium]